MRKEFRNRIVHLLAEKEIEETHMKESCDEILIAMEDADFIWTGKQVKEFRYLWKRGMSVVHIADYLKRTQEEVIILLIDQATKGLVEKRKNGLLGDY